MTDSAIKKFFLVVSFLLGTGSHATCYEKKLSANQIENISGQDNSITMEWNGLIRNGGHIAIGNDDLLVADFSCAFDASSSNSVDGRRCNIDEGGGQFFAAMSKDEKGKPVIVKSILVNGKFSGVQADDSKTNSLGIRGKGNLNIEMDKVDDSKCNDIFNAPIGDPDKQAGKGTPRQIQGSATTAHEDD